MTKIGSTESHGDPYDLAVGRLILIDLTNGGSIKHMRQQLNFSLSDFSHDKFIIVGDLRTIKEDKKRDMSFEEISNLFDGM